jgi:uncharacterized repeat protein (TIGR01451 family)
LILKPLAMKKNYFNSLLLLFVIFFNYSSYGQIVANTDVGTVINNNTSQIVIPNVLNNDTLNGLPISLSDVTITQISASTSALIQLESNGSVTLSPGTINSGNYYIGYQICQISNPTNCTSATASVYVTNPPIVAINDAVTIASNSVAPQIIIEDILANDTLNGLPISLSNATIIAQVSSTAATYFSIGSTGAVSLIAGSVPPGTYVMEYHICQSTLPNNCTQQASVTITVINSLSTTITGTYQDLNADGITNVGDVINYTFSTTNIGTTTVTNVAIVSSEVNINGGPPIPSLAAGATNNSTYTGVHVLTQADINAASAVITIQTTGVNSGGNPISVSATNSKPLSISSGIRLNAFIDYNGNGAQDAGEPNFTSGEFQFILNNDTVVHHIVSSTGIDYIYETNAANSYDLSYTITGYLATQYSVAPSSYANITVANGSGITTYNFALSVIPFSDLAVQVYSWDRPMPGFYYTVNIYYANNGNQTIPSAAINFTIPTNNASVQIISGSTGSVTQNANGFTANLTNITPGYLGYISVTMQIPTIPTVSLGDLVTTAATITIPSNDIYVNNNSSSVSNVIVGSYDPNEKSEAHGGKILHSAFTANDYLTYTIQFENTGTANAINIRVTDALDAKLDENTVTMVAASGAYVLERVGNNLTWKFNGVNLPPSSPASTTIGHGYIVFKVKPKSGYAIGDIIPNTASIYFDFNPAIVTDPCLTEFVATLSNASFAFNNFSFYPNPVKNTLFISNGESMEKVEISSILGQSVMTKNINDLQTEIDLAELQRGIYFVKVSSNGQQKTVKIIKE